MPARRRQGAEKGAYARIVEEIFRRHYEPGLSQFEFEREEIVQVAEQLGLQRPKNLGDVIYSIRYRQGIPPGVAAVAPEGKEWIIEGAGRSRYRFRLVSRNEIRPLSTLRAIAIPDATPEIVRRYSTADEQGLLARLRYNRLLDLFLEVVAYPLQSHLRSTIRSRGAQIEIDDLYVGINAAGEQSIIPVQAKGGRDKLSVVQSEQDVVWCLENFPGLQCRPVSAQFLSEDEVALFELQLRNGEIHLVQEAHYRLVEGAAAREGNRN